MGEFSSPEFTSLSVLALIWCLFHLRVTAVAHKRPRSFCQKCRWQVIPEQAYILYPTKLEWANHAVHPGMMQ